METTETTTPVATPRRRYPSDLTDAEWLHLEAVLPQRGRERGRPTTVDLREICNGLFYWARTGCQWRALPTDLPNWNTVRYYFDKWRDDGTWEAINDALREAVREVVEEREPT